MSLIDWDYGISKFKSGVVRVVFVKKGDGNVREMWGTRNSQLISEYLGAGAGTDRLGEDDREILKRQKNNNNIVVFDLEKEGFRTVPLDNVLSVDEFNAVPGWIEFGLNGSWQDIIDGKTTIYEYVG